MLIMTTLETLVLDPHNPDPQPNPINLLLPDLSRPLFDHVWESFTVFYLEDFIAQSTQLQAIEVLPHFHAVYAPIPEDRFEYAFHRAGVFNRLSRAPGSQLTKPRRTLLHYTALYKAYQRDVDLQSHDYPDYRQTAYYDAERQAIEHIPFLAKRPREREVYLQTLERVIDRDYPTRSSSPYRPPQYPVASMRIPTSGHNRPENLPATPTRTQYAKQLLNRAHELGITLEPENQV